MTSPRVMLSYGYQPYTTGVYVERALKQAGCEVDREPYGAERYAWRDTRHDLYLWVEGSASMPNPARPKHYACPTAAWFIDSYTRLEEQRYIATEFDCVFVAQKHFAKQVRSDAIWLPMACDPELHTPHEGVPVEYDIAFVGNTYGDHPLYAERRRLLALLSERYKVSVESNVYFQDMADVYASARVAFNRSACGDLNMRVFETMCSGTPLVTDGVPGLQDAFGLDTWLPYYHSDNELLDLMAELLSDPTWAREIGARARTDVLAHHTYLHRVQTILQAVGL